MRSKCSSVSFECGGVGGLGGLGGGGAVVGGCMLVYIYVGWAVWWLFGDWFGCGLEFGLKETCEGNMRARASRVGVACGACVGSEE